ncbi:hypothetical protein [Nonomuraea sp. NPDC023979]|uniref:hypothetical protein n=1 Tax=Nonomuraea sp. NPDC023979 TaxID=3154796 RepID=UPI0033D25FFA
MAKLPSTIYYLATSNRPRPYVSAGHVKQALKGRGWSCNQLGCKVYRVSGHVNGELAWEDVTDEFLPEAKW